MLADRYAWVHGKQKAGFFPALRFYSLYVLFKLLVFHYDIFFVGELAYFSDKVCWINKVDYKYPVEKANAEWKRQIPREPFKRADNMRVYQKIIDRAQRCPEKWKQRAYYSVDIAPFIWVIPQLYFHMLDKNKSRYIFDKGYAQRHKYKKRYLFYGAALYRQYAFKHCHIVQNAKAEAVQRQIRTYQKARIYPLFSGEKSAENYL